MEKESASATKAADAFYFKCTIKLQIVLYHMTENVVLMRCSVILCHVIKYNI